MSDEEMRANNEKVFERLGISRMSDEEIRAHNEKVFERLGISPTPASP
jgi:antitoxin component of RelBE/YafQ-DinJ toxin-antitoxin module